MFELYYGRKIPYYYSNNLLFYPAVEHTSHNFFEEEVRYCEKKIIHLFVHKATSKINAVQNNFIFTLAMMKNK